MVLQPGQYRVVVLNPRFDLPGDEQVVEIRAGEESQVRFVADP